MKKWVACFSVLLLPSLLFADFNFATTSQVPNVHPGYCVWCSLETLAMHHGIKELWGVRDEYVRNNPFGGTTAVEAEQELRQSGVKHVVYAEGPKYWSVLSKACEVKLGCVVAVYGWPREKSYHAIVITDIKDSKVLFWDCNSLIKWQASVEWLDQHWTGFLIVIYPNK